MACVRSGLQQMVHRKQAQLHSIVSSKIVGTWGGLRAAHAFHQKTGALRFIQRYKSLDQSECCCRLQPPSIDASDLQAPKALWHEDTRGPRGHQQHSLQPGVPQFYPNGRPVGPVSQAGFRMLNHSLHGSLQGPPPGMVRLLRPAVTTSRALRKLFSRALADHSEVHRPQQAFLDVKKSLPSRINVHESPSKLAGLPCRDTDPPRC